MLPPEPEPEPTKNVTAPHAWSEVFIQNICTVPSSCYPAPSLEPIFGQYLGSRGSTDDQMMCVNEGWCPTFE